MATCGYIHIMYVCHVYYSNRRTASTPADGGRADTPAGGGQAGAIVLMGIRTCLRYGGKGDTEGAPTWRQERRINNRTAAVSRFASDPEETTCR
jgi:hypothetical protein